MERMIFINLATKDLTAARNFYTGLGFNINPDFSDDNCACIVVSDTIFVMVMKQERFADFSVTPIADTANSTEVINCLSARSREEVDSLFAKAMNNGGSAWQEKMEQGPMYGHSFADPDGHAWEILFMEMTTRSSG